MIQHVLVPIDSSVKANKALEFVLEEFPGTDITTLSVIIGLLLLGRQPTPSDTWCVGLTGTTPTDD